MDWNLFWAIAWQVLLGSLILRLAWLPWELRTAFREAKKTRGEKIL